MSTVRFIRAAPVLFLFISTATLGACAISDDVEPRAMNVNESTDEAQNNSVLLNIVRAKDNEPLNFISVPKVNESTKTSLGLGLPTFTVSDNNNASGITFNNSTIGGSAGADSLYDVTVLDNRPFYAGMLAPLTAETVNFFLRQGYPRQLLFWLFTDSVRVRQNGLSVERRNEPPGHLCEYGQDCFLTYLDDALKSGLFTEVREKTVHTTIADKPAQIKVNETRFCFEPALRADDYTRVNHPICGRSEGPDAWQDAPGGISVQGRSNYEIEVVPRSTYAIYQYLGRMLRYGDTNLDLDERTSDPFLLTVVAGRNVGCFAVAERYGINYCVPVEQGDNTKRIFTILRQLQALNTDPRDLPLTPTFRLTP